MLKFWLALILGTIGIAAGLTYLKLHRGAQTISYPPVAAKTKSPAIEFSTIKPNSDDNKMEISANVVMFNVKESLADAENEVSCQLKNSGEGTLELSLKHASCTCIEIYFDKQRVTMTEHQVKIAPGQTAVVRLLYKPKLEPGTLADGRSRITATFEHNDERYNDNIHFEIVTRIKPGKG